MNYQKLQTKNYVKVIGNDNNNHDIISPIWLLHPQISVHRRRLVGMMFSWRLEWTLQVDSSRQLGAILLTTQPPPSPPIYYPVCQLYLHLHSKKSRDFETSIRKFRCQKCYSERFFTHDEALIKCVEIAATSFYFSLVFDFFSLSVSHVAL